MAQLKNEVSVLDSDRKGLNVLIIDTDERRSTEFEARTELDPYLQRINVFFVSNIREARNLVKSKRIEIAIFPESLETMDFVSIQNELKNANDSCKTRQE